MNKLFVVVLLAGFGACFGLIDLLPGFCKVEADCGRNKCCLGGRICSPKLQANFPCLLQSFHKCGCAEGLACQVTATLTILGKKYEYRQCRAAEVPVVPEEINAEPRREKRFLPRSCSNDSDCGVKRYCSSVANKCVLKLPLNSTCATNSCCEEDKECRVTYTIYNPLTGEKIYEIRQCKLASEPSEVRAMEVTEA